MEITYVQEGDIYRVIHKTDEVLTAESLAKKEVGLTKVLADLTAIRGLSLDSIKLTAMVTSRYGSDLDSGTLTWSQAVDLHIADFKTHLDAITAATKEK